MIVTLGIILAIAIFKAPTILLAGITVSWLIDALFIMLLFDTIQMKMRNSKSEDSENGL